LSSETMFYITFVLTQPSVAKWVENFGNLPTFLNFVIHLVKLLPFVMWG